MSTFPPIADYGFLSNCEQSCLVAPDGSVEWLCLPRPDSPSVFGALLDRAAGLFRFGPSNTHVPQHRRYVPGTMVLETTWQTPTGWMIVQDFLAIGPVQHEGRRPDYHRAPADFGAVGALVRIATCISGRVEAVVNCGPLFNYGAAGGTWSYKGDGYDAMTIAPAEGDVRLELAGTIPLGVLGARCYGRTTLTEGQSAFVALSWGGDHVPASQDEAFSALNTTVDFWRDWLSSAKIPDHPWKPYLDRSALTLKGLSYAPTGAIMAASTTSLPETPGGARNWDYRFTWIRDSAFMLRSLYRLGFDWEAIEYWGFVIDAVSGGDLNRKLELQIMYGIGGERDLTEQTLDHLSGYRGARPVRVGNGAWNQQQHDVWGMILDALDVQFHNGAGQIVAPVWEGLAGFVDAALQHWREPDQGIWEVRGDPKHFTASKVMCWVAASRGADLAQERGDDERAKRWRAGADEIKAEILDKGLSKPGRVPAALRDRRPRRLAAAAAHHGVPAPRRQAHQSHRAGHRRRADPGRPGPALPGRGNRHRVRGQRRNVHHLLLLAGDRAGHDRRNRTRARPVPEAAVVRRTAAAVRGGDRRHHRRASWATSRRPSPTWP